MTPIIQFKFPRNQQGECGEAWTRKNKNTETKFEGQFEVYLHIFAPSELTENGVGSAFWMIERVI